MHLHKRLAAGIVGFVFLTTVLSGCVRKPLLSDVHIRPDIISPNADGTEDVAEIKYLLSRNSTLTMYFIDEAGERHYYREEVRRSPGPRTTYFGGAINGSLLPDGRYVCVLEASDERGRAEKVEKPLTIQGGDLLPLRIEGMSVFPDSFEPNRDGVRDRVTVAYRLNKEASLVEVYLLDAEGTKYPIPEDRIRDMGAAGNHEHDYDAGVDLGAAPPKDGTYTVVGLAEKTSGRSPTRWWSRPRTSSGTRTWQPIPSLSRWGACPMWRS